MDNAPKIAVLVVLALIIGVIFFATGKDYANNVSSQTQTQTNDLFNKIGE